MRHHDGAESLQHLNLTIVHVDYSIRLELVCFLDRGSLNLHMLQLGYLALLLLVVYVLWERFTRASKGLPPGPPSLPILGHLLVMPQKDQADVLYQWSRRYGAC